MNEMEGPTHLNGQIQTPLQKEHSRGAKNILAANIMRGIEKTLITFEGRELQDFGDMRVVDTSEDFKFSLKITDGFRRQKLRTQQFQSHQTAPMFPIFG